MVLRMTSSGYKVQGCPGSIPGWVFKKEKKKKAYILYMCKHCVVCQVTIGVMKDELKPNMVQNV